MNVDVLMALARGEARRRQRVLDPRRLGDVDTPLVQERSRSQLRAEHFVPRGIDNHAGDQLARSLERERRVENGETVREVRGSIQRVDVPTILGRAFLPAALLRHDRVSRKVPAQTLDDQPFAGAIGFRHQVISAFEIEMLRAARAVIYGTGDELSRLASDLYRSL